MTEHIVEAERLYKVFKQGDVEITAVRDVNIAIPKGEFVSIVGHSGSGKTTLLSLLGGLTRPTQGKVWIDGTNIWTLGDREISKLRNNKIGFMFQFSSLIPTLNVLDNLVLPTTFGGGKVEDGVYEKARNLLQRVGMEEKLYAYPNHLSGGQQRRVAITRAFMNDPQIILADEPTGDLDEDTEAEVMELFKAIHKEKNLTIFMVTHSRSLAEQASIRYYMKDGIIKEEG